VKCWGANTHGQLGNNTTTSSSSPVTPAGITSPVWLGAGDQHSCVATQSGSALCWGYNLTGQLGNNDAGVNAERTAPTAVLNISNVTRIDGGIAHTCALHGAGDVSC
jgi:alpha-tubulin suppressor-like RCC1 family protein